MNTHSVTALLLPVSGSIELQGSLENDRPVIDGPRKIMRWKCRTYGPNSRGGQLQDVHCICMSLKDQMSIRN